MHKRDWTTRKLGLPKSNRIRKPAPLKRRPTSRRKLIIRQLTKLILWRTSLCSRTLEKLSQRTFRRRHPKPLSQQFDQWLTGCHPRNQKLQSSTWQSLSINWTIRLLTKSVWTVDFKSKTTSSQNHTNRSKPQTNSSKSTLTLRKSNISSKMLKFSKESLLVSQSLWTLWTQKRQVEQATKLVIITRSHHRDEQVCNESLGNLYWHSCRPKPIVVPITRPESTLFLTIGGF